MVRRLETGIMSACREREPLSAPAPSKAEAAPRPKGSTWAAPFTPSQQKETTRRRARGATLQELARSYGVCKTRPYPPHRQNRRAGTKYRKALGRHPGEGCPNGWSTVGSCADELVSVAPAKLQFGNGCPAVGLITLAALGHSVRWG